MLCLDSIQVIFSPKTSREKIALNNISLTVKKGEFIVIVGGNGAGKSTLLNVIAGDIYPIHGKILIDNQDITNQPTYKRSHIISRVFQDPLSGTCSDLTVSENLLLSQMRGKKHNFLLAESKNKKKGLSELLKILNMGLEQSLDLSVSILSGGQRQAISLAMATQGDLKILLLDEHTAALDPKTSYLIMELTDHLVKKHNITTLMITHSIQYALSFGSRIIALKNGSIIDDISGESKKKLTNQDLISKFYE